MITCRSDSVTLRFLCEPLHESIYQVRGSGSGITIKRFHDNDSTRAFVVIYESVLYFDSNVKSEIYDSCIINNN